MRPTLAPGAVDSWPGGTAGAAPERPIGGRALTTQALETGSLLLPAGTRLVHIGPPKTGTTALQGAFHRNRDSLLAQGVRYAGRRRHSGAAVLAVTERPAFSQDQGAPPISAWNSLAREARTAREPRVVVSSEFFADALPAYLPRIVTDLGGDAVRVVITLRPLGRILPSQWQQYVQSGLRQDYDPWLRAVFGPDGRAATPTFWRRHRHDELVARWAAVVGPERVTAIVVDESDHGQLFRLFEAMLGLRDGTLTTEQDLANRSMTWPEIQAVRAFNVAFKGAGLGNALFHKVMHFSAATHMKLQPPPPEWPRIETPQWALDRAGEVSREIVAGIAASGVRVVGDLDALTVVPRGRPDDAPPPDTAVPPEIAASMAMGVLLASGLARRGSDGSLRARGGRTWFEPPELARLPTHQLAGAVVMRSRDAVVRRLRRVRRVAGRGSG